jgi:hypothetical protein
MRFAIRLAVSLFVVQSAFAQCDVARGPVMAGVDADARYVDAAAPLPITIAALHEISAPRPLPQSSRVMPVETTLYSVHATLMALTVDADSSYQLLLSDDAGRTMLATLPPPGCIDASPFAAQILAARTALEARVEPMPVAVEVQGLGFFNFIQGQAAAAPNGIELHPVTSIVFPPAAAASPTVRRRAVVGTNPRPACPFPTVALQLSRSSVCPGETVTLSWQASDAAATVTIAGVGANLPASGSTVVGTTSSLAYSARATSACGTGPEAVAVLNIVQGASGSLSANPSSIQQNASATITLTTANAVSWSISSSLGNALSPASGTASGTVSIAYTGSRGGTDTIVLTAVGRACGTIQRTTSIVVNSSSPPPPPPTGFLRCCDGTTSPTCTSCAHKQGCCSSHGGVCGC